MDIKELKENFEKLGTLRLAVYQTKGEGPSSTKIVYLNVGLVLAYGWAVLAVSFAVRYLWKGTADIIFAGVITALAPVVIGFATSAHKAKNQAQVDAAKDANAQAPPSGSVP